MLEALAFQSLLLVAQLTFLVIVIALVLKITAIAISNGYDSPFLETPSALLPRIAEALAIQPGDVVYDLGCGDGRLLLYCAKVEPRARYVGVERNSLLFAYAHFKKWTAGNPKNIEFRRQDLFQIDVHDASKIYTYLLTKTVNSFFSSAEKHLKGVRLVSRAFQLNGKIPNSTVRLSQKVGFHGEHMLYIYEL